MKILPKIYPTLIGVSTVSFLVILCSVVNLSEREWVSGPVLGMAGILVGVQLAAAAFFTASFFVIQRQVIRRVHRIHPSADREELEKVEGRMNEILKEISDNTRFVVLSMLPLIACSAWVYSDLPSIEWPSWPMTKLEFICGTCAGLLLLQLLAVYDSIVAMFRVHEIKGWSEEDGAM